MKIRIERKDNIILIKSSICVVLGASVIGALCYKTKTIRKKSANVMKEVARNLFTESLSGKMNQLGNEGVNWNFEIDEIEVISGDLNEFLVKVIYDLNLSDEFEREFHTEQWMMKIRKVDKKRYEIVEQATQLEEEK